MPGLGEEFRAAREARGLSLSDVSEHIHIRNVYLQSIEDEDWAAIAAPVYVRGFIRTYARFLGLDGEHAVAAFNESIGGKERIDTPVAVSSSFPERRPSPWLFAAGAAALLLVAFVAFSYVQYQQNASSQVATTSDVAADATASPAAVAARQVSKVEPKHAPRHTGKPPRTLELRVTQASWVLVKIDGIQALEGIFPPGTVKEFHGGTKAMIRAGNAGGVALTVNGRALGKMGKSGAVVDRVIGLTEE